MSAHRTPDKVHRTCQCLRGIVHPTRLRILVFLRDGEMTVNELVIKTAATQANISQHLAQMRDRGILTSRRQGNQIFYTAANERLFALLDLMEEIFCRKTSEASS